MYSYEDRMKAVQLFIKYDLALTDTIRELGYPDRSQLKAWYKEYLERGDLHRNLHKKSKYTKGQMKGAVDYYWEHGRSLGRTVKKLGYPLKPALKTRNNKGFGLSKPGSNRSCVRSNELNFFGLRDS